MAPTAAQVQAVERLVHESVQAVDALTPQAMHALLPALLRAREELQKDLQKWMQDHPDGAERFTVLQKKQALLALESSFQRIADLQPAMAQALGKGRKATGGLAAKNLEHEVQRLSAIFDGGMATIPQLDTAAVVALGNKLLWKRHENSAKRYAGGIGDDIKTRMAVSLAKGDTFEQMVQRLRGSAQFVAAVKASDPGAAAHGCADAMFNRWRHWADRLVRTENMHAYNTQHDLAIEHVNANRSEDDDEYLRRWDATADKVVCPRCAALDRTVATIEGTFAGGVKSPPLHPYCRCVVLAWLARWGNIKGEIPALHHGGDEEIIPQQHIEEKRRAKASADAKAAAAEELDAFNKHEQAKQEKAAKAKAMDAQIAAAKAKQAKLLEAHKAKLAAEKAKAAAAAEAKAAQEAAAKAAAEKAALEAKLEAEAKAKAKAEAELKAKIEAEAKALKLAAEKAAAEAAAKAAELAKAQAEIAAAAKAKAEKQALEHAEALAKQKADEAAAKAAKLAKAKEKKAAKLASGAAPFDPETSKTIGYIPKGKAKGKAHLLSKPGMVQIDANTIQGHGYLVKWDPNDGHWVTQSGPMQQGYSYNHGTEKWTHKDATPTPKPAPAPTPTAAASPGIVGPKPAPIVGHEWKDIGGKWVLHDMSGTPTHTLVKPWSSASPTLPPKVALGGELAKMGLVPTGPGVMEGHGAKYVKHADGNWYKTEHLGQPYKNKETPEAHASAQASLEAHPSGFKRMTRDQFDEACAVDAKAIKGEQRDGVYAYSGNSYTSINGDSFNGHHGLRHPPPSAYAQKHIDNIDKAFKNPAARMKQDAILFRGSGGKAYFDSFDVGGVFEDKGFVSTSMSTENGFYQGGEVRFHISVPKGHPAIAMNSTLSAHSSEKEILLPRSSKFRVLKKEMVGGRLYIHCEVVPHAP